MSGYDERMEATGMTEVMSYRALRLAVNAGGRALDRSVREDPLNPGDPALANASAAYRQPAGLRRQCRRPVFFESDSSELTPQSVLDAGEAGAMAAQLQPIRIPDRRPCRRARHARIQHRARRPPRPGGARLSRLARRARHRMRTISYGKERPVAVLHEFPAGRRTARSVTVLNASS